jgi:hypothetical protein
LGVLGCDTMLVCEWLLTWPSKHWELLTQQHITKFLKIKPTRCTNFSNLFLEWHSTCFRQFFCPSSGVFHCTHSNGICHTGLLTACAEWHIPLLCVQWKTPDDGQRNCPKHVEFHSKKKFEKLVHLVGFILRNLSRCTVTWTSAYYQISVDWMLSNTTVRTPNITY